MRNHANNLGRYFCGRALYDYSVWPRVHSCWCLFLLLVLSFIPYYRLHNEPLILGATPGIAVVLAYCNLNPNLKDSDKNRQEFATHYLEHLCFLYAKSDGDDPLVRTLIQISN